jgi:Ubiquitin-conjugating enzyme
VKFLTTNSGHWRANPNLYANGKVCLSLLNTWATPQWQPGQSTLLQVIISIQSMILVSRPYFNEPGFGDPDDSPRSLAYSSAVRDGVVKNAMLAHLKSLKTYPNSPFADVIRTHFKLKKERIVAQIEKWKSFQTNEKRFSELCESMASELEKL